MITHPTLSASGAQPRRAWSTFVLLVALLGSSLLTTACARKSGCPVNDQATTKVDRKGGFSKKKNSSNLFPKDMRKQMKM